MKKSSKFILTLQEGPRLLSLTCQLAGSANRLLADRFPAHRFPADRFPADRLSAVGISHAATKYLDAAG
jgi:hypothetical protein